MPGLLDIAPPEIAAETFEFRGGSLTVRGIRNREWAMLLRRFPELRKQAAGIAVPEEDMAAASIEVMPAVIAAGAGNIGDEAIEGLIVERLTDAEQAEVFGTIMRLTHPPLPLAESPVAAGQANGKTTATLKASSS